MKCWKLNLMALATLASAPAMGGTYELVTLTVNPGDSQTVVGDSAALLFGTLPSSPYIVNNPGQQKHFRSLALPVGNGNHLLIECTDAAWEFQGEGRLAHNVLVQDTPNCTVSFERLSSGTVLRPLPLAEVLAAAAAANAIVAPLPAAKGPADSDLCPPHSRICK